MRLVLYFATFVGGAVACFLLFSLGIVDTAEQDPLFTNDPAVTLPTYISFIGVMMTSVTVVLASVAVGIGVVAFYTIPGLRTEAGTVAKKAAEDTARGVASEALAEVKVRAMVAELYAADKKNRENDDDWDGEPVDETR